MPRESYIRGAVGMRTDSRRQKWVKMLNHYQDQSGSLRGNDPRLGNSRREIMAKLLAALQFTTVKGGGVQAAVFPVGSLTLTGAGSTVVNGDYVISGTQNGQNTYYKIAGNVSIFWDGGAWDIMSGPVLFYASPGPDVDDPAWILAGGLFPPPTVFQH